MTDFDDLCCDHCGNRHIEHFQTRDGQWQNRCQGCGRVTEYIPTKAEIAAACEAIRAARPWQSYNDADERLLRLAEAVLGSDDWDDEDDDFDAAPAVHRMNRAAVKAEACPAVRRAG